MRARLPWGEGLRAELGVPRRVRGLASSPRSRVWRAELSGTPVVVKQLVEGPEAEDRYAREVTALRLASRVDPPVVPGVLGVDPGARVLVLEHVAERPPPGDWVIGYAEALARLHAATGPDDTGLLPAWSGPTGADVDAFLGLARTLGCAVPSAVRAELEALVDRLARTPATPSCTATRARATTCTPAAANSGSSTSNRPRWATAWWNSPTCASVSRPAGAPPPRTGRCSTRRRPRTARRGAARPAPTCGESSRTRARAGC